MHTIQRSQPMRTAIFLLAALSAPLSAGAAGDWTVLEDCRLDAHNFQDGDSFTIRHQGERHIIRLYFVDCPETDTGLEDRLAEQAEYFHTSPARVKTYGKRAANFTRRQLGGQRFTVYTRWADARGAERHDRVFGYVELDDGFLSEKLVEAGLARIHGMSANRPDGLNESRVWSRLQRLEKDARANRRGLWSGGGAGEPDRPSPLERAMGKIRFTPNVAIPVHSVRPPHPQATFLQAGTEAGLVKREDDGWVRIRFRTRDGESLREGLVRESSIARFLDN